MDFVAGCRPARPQTEQVKYTLLKPEDKTSETVKDGERNPYRQERERTPSRATRRAPTRKTRSATGW